MLLAVFAIALLVQQNVVESAPMMTGSASSPFQLRPLPKTRSSVRKSFPLQAYKDRKTAFDDGLIDDVNALKSKSRRKAVYSAYMPNHPNVESADDRDEFTLDDLFADLNGFGPKAARKPEKPQNYDFEYVRPEAVNEIDDKVDQEKEEEEESDN